jgi:hypothetical protein
LLSALNSCDSGGVEAIEPGHARIFVRPMAGQGAKIAPGGEEFRLAADLLGADRIAAKA